MKAPARITLTCAFIFFSTGGPANAASEFAYQAPEDNRPAPIASFSRTNKVTGDILDLSLIFLDTEKSEGLSLGLEYEAKIRRSLGPKPIDPNDPALPNKTGKPGTLSDEAPSIFAGYYDLSARGTIASSSAKTSNKLLDFSGSLGAEYDTEPAYFSAGGIVSHEIDQSRDNRQTMYGANVSATKILFFNQPSIFQGAGITAQLAYGRVNPSADVERMKVLGNLNNYNRWHGELSYTMRLPSTRVTNFVVNYRRYQEVSAPVAIKTAGLDTHNFWYVKLYLNVKGERVFIAYSNGSLPFDQKDVRAIKIGWTTDLRDVLSARK